MSSYFVNSFCGRYPNGADFQLHNYGEHDPASEQYRNSTTVHSSRYGYGYNGMDLTVGRDAAGHFAADTERTRGYTEEHSAAPAESLRYARSANATGTSLSPPPDPVACSSAPPASEAPPQRRVAPNSAATPCPSSSGAGALLTGRDCASQAAPPEEEKPAGGAPATPQNVSDSAQPQIYPWMRKIHISHGNPVDSDLVSTLGSFGCDISDSTKTDYLFPKIY